MGVTSIGRHIRPACTQGFTRSLKLCKQCRFNSCVRVFFIPMGSRGFSWAIWRHFGHMGEMRDSDWSRPNLLRSDWLPIIVASMTTNSCRNMTRRSTSRMLSGSMDTLEEKWREFLGFKGCYRLGIDGVEEGDDVSSVGRIWLRCLWPPKSLGSWELLTKQTLAPTASKIWGSGQMEVGSVCLGTGVSVRGWRASTQSSPRSAGRPALRNHQAKE